VLEPLGDLAAGVQATTLLAEVLAAFSAGITIASLSPPMREAFQQFGELIAELLKLAAILVFSSLISISFLGDIGLRGYLFAALALFAARPLALGIALLRSKLPRRERLAAAWFGPKGFASVVYGLLILEAGLEQSDEVFHLVALAVATRAQPEITSARASAAAPTTPASSPSDDTAKDNFGFGCNIHGRDASKIRSARSWPNFSAIPPPTTTKETSSRFTADPTPMAMASMAASNS